MSTQEQNTPTPCKECNGTGTKTYENTSTWRYGIGGDAMTDDVCDECWGTGDENFKGPNLRTGRVEAESKHP